MNEEEFKGRITGMCDWYRLQWCHFRPARTEKGWRTPLEGRKGFPDLVISGPGGCIFRELKSEKGKVAPEQQTWIDMLTNAGEDAKVWRPSDWPEVVDTLKALSKRPSTR